MLLRALFDFDPVLRIPVRWKNKADKLLRHLCFKPAFSRDLLKNLIEALEMQIIVYCMHSYLSQVQTNGPGCILFEISITQMFNVGRPVLVTTKEMWKISTTPGGTIAVKSRPVYALRSF